MSDENEMVNTTPFDDTADDKNASPTLSATDKGYVPALAADGQHGPVGLDEVDNPTDGKITPSVSDYFTLLASGFALVSDGFQNNLPSYFNLAFKKLYPKIYTSAVSTRVSNALLVGEVFGQILVGIICDRIGRKTAMVGTTLFIVIGGILATAAGPTGNPAGMFWMLTLARGMVGVGVGGEYPACSTSASESANEKFGRDRGKVFILVTNLMLSIGSPIVVSLALLILGGSHYGNTVAGHDRYILQYTWRILMAIGVVIPLTVFYFRLKMMNSKLYRRNSLKRSMPPGVYLLIIKRYWRTLIGTAGTWFLYDFVTFPNGIFSSTIISEVIPHATLMRTLEWNLLLSVLSLPGVFLGAWVVKYTGRRNLLMMGFSGYIVFGLIVGISFDKIIKVVPAFIVMYGFMQSSGNFGPGNMEGTISAESYPTSIRGTCYGLSAALGKTGAALGTQAFTPIQTHLGKRYTFIIAACCGLVGVILAYFFVEDKGKDRLEKEDEAWRVYLVENGYAGLDMGDGSAGFREAEENEERGGLSWEK